MINPFHVKIMGMLLLKPSGTSQDLDTRMCGGEGMFFVSSQRRDSSELADDHTLLGHIFKCKAIAILSNQCTDEHQ
jgi:hypothetical protein